ncbi:gem-associated protein 2 [Tetranychus urticae]|uniref:Gem-associated protein 2 n=1 Tax=Tetranychus urticae TaxID=32264 RepID=T1L3A0_TETUR|nr:gem-associated protein 2 [Tetranychus urticae]
MDESDGEHDNLAQPTALPVSNITNFDPSVPPSSGEEYLKRVQLEAKSYPDVTIAKSLKHPKSGHSNYSKSYGLLATERFIKAEPEICQSQVWADDTIRCFKSIRDKVAEARESFSNGLHLKDVEKTPHFRDLQLWRKIILGNAEESEEKNCESDSEIKVVYKTNGGKGPLLSTILQFPQVAVIDFLETLTCWVKKYGWCHQLAVWIYSLLACLDIPLHSETVSVIRELSRACSIIRAKHKQIEDKSLVTSLNLIICIIGLFFGQLDITDDFIKTSE